MAAAADSKAWREGDLGGASGETVLDAIAAGAGKLGKPIAVEGHTDAKGSVAYNKKLSDRRAASVRSYLMQKGVTEDRITSVGYGKIVSIASNDTDEGRAQNRRVVIVVSPEDAS